MSNWQDSFLQDGLGPGWSHLEDWSWAPYIAPAYGPFGIVWGGFLGGIYASRTDQPAISLYGDEIPKRSFRLSVDGDAGNWVGYFMPSPGSGGHPAYFLDEGVGYGVILSGQPNLDHYFLGRNVMRYVLPMGFLAVCEFVRVDLGVETLLYSQAYSNYATGPLSLHVSPTAILFTSDRTYGTVRHKEDVALSETYGGLWVRRPIDHDPRMWFASGGTIRKWGVSGEYPVHQVIKGTQNFPTSEYAFSGAAAALVDYGTYLDASEFATSWLGDRSLLVGAALGQTGYGYNYGDNFGG